MEKFIIKSTLFHFQKETPKQGPDGEPLSDGDIEKPAPSKKRDNTPIETPKKENGSIHA